MGQTQTQTVTRTKKITFGSPAPDLSQPPAQAAMTGDHMKFQQRPALHSAHDPEDPDKSKK